MRKVMLGLFVFSIILPASAAPLESVIESFAIPSNEDYTVNMWEDTTSIKGVEWKWPYYESGAHDYRMLGMIHIGSNKKSDVGSGYVDIRGSRMNLGSIFVYIGGLKKDHSKKEISRIFGKGQVRKINTICDVSSNSDPYSDITDTYTFKKPGYKPVYIRATTSWRSTEANGSSYVIYNQLPEVEFNTCSIRYSYDYDPEYLGE